MLFVQKKDVVLRNIDGLFFLVDITKKDYADNSFMICINEMGKFIWDCLKQTCSMEELTKSIINSLVGDDPEFNEIYNDTKDFIDQVRPQQSLLDMWKEKPKTVVSLPP